RQVFGLPGETVCRVPSLALPVDSPPLTGGKQSTPHLSGLNCQLVTPPAAMQLFLERARGAAATFALTPRNAPAVAQICRRLDGIPLAIELAAARVSAMPVDQIAGRLDDRFRLLTGGSRTALRRHQTLRATLDWSWGLLTELERVLLRR